MISLFNGEFQDKVILVTGHTGFKGSWLSYWLSELGAKVIGFSLDIPTNPNHFELLDLSDEITHIVGDVRDLQQLSEVFNNYKPDLVFHLAAQSLVRPSYDDPVTTFNTNVLGTANILECSRLTRSVLGVVNVTSDKCYENFEDDRAYKEDDRMGGYDPYSASKGCAELLANSYRSSFFNIKDYGDKHHVLLANVRAGNVIGGGDWSKNRLIPDLIRAASLGQVTSIRSPLSTRPWQHVLEPLSGYLLIGQNILQKNKAMSDGWNFGPLNNETLSVEDVITRSAEIWDKVRFEIEIPKNAPHEAKLLSLNCDKAKSMLSWRPVWSEESSIKKTLQWYKQYYENGTLDTATQLEEYASIAVDRKYIWAV